MKKIFIFICCAMALLMIFTAASTFSDPVKDKKDEETDKLSSSTTENVETQIPTSIPVTTETPVTEAPDPEPESPYEDSTFYYYNESNELVSTTTFTGFEYTGLGFYMRDGDAYFCCVKGVSPGVVYRLDLDMFGGEFSGYPSCQKQTTDMITEFDVSFVDFLEEPYPDAICLVYCIVEDCEDPLEVMEIINAVTPISFLVGDEGSDENPSSPVQTENSTDIVVDPGISDGPS